MYMVMFVVNSILLGFGLAMDAFSVSLVSGMQAPGMRRARKARIAGTFAGFQFMMPMIGWVCVRTVAEIFTPFQTAIPWLAMGLLLFIGGRMILEALRGGEEENRFSDETGILLMLGVATSIDALSVGFTIAGYQAAEAWLCCLLIGAVTYLVCRAGISLGTRFGTRMAGHAQILGGAILILIGLEIFLEGVIFPG